MSRKAKLPSKRKIQEYASFSKFLRVTEDNLLFCEACDKLITSDKRSHVIQHLSTNTHTSHAKMNEPIALNPKMKVYPSHIIVPNNNEFCTNLCSLLITMNLPLSTIKKPTFTDFLKKYADKVVPTEKTLLNTYLPQMYFKVKGMIRDRLSSCFLCTMMDVKIDSQGRCLCYILVGEMCSDAPTNPYLAAVKHLEKVDSEMISRCLDETLSDLFDNKSIRERLLLLVTSNAPYMRRTANLLKLFYPKLVHVMCVVQMLSRVCDEIRSQFPLVCKWITLVDKITSSPSHLMTYKELHPDLPLPPDPSSSWIERAVFCATNFEKLKHIIENLCNLTDDEDFSSTENPTSLITNEQLPFDLLLISSFKFLDTTIKLLADPRLSIKESIPLLDETTSKLAMGSIYTKIEHQIEANPGLAFCRDVYQILNCDVVGKKSEVAQKYSIKEVFAFKYAPLMISPVNECVSICKNIPSDALSSFTMDSLEMYLVCTFNVNADGGASGSNSNATDDCDNSCDYDDDEDEDDKKC